MPNKTIYVSDGDLELIEKASAQYGGNLSSTIVKILKESLENDGPREESPNETDLHEVIVQVGQSGCYIKQRFTGRLIAKWISGTSSDRLIQSICLYATQKGRFALHFRSKANPDIDWNDWKAWKSYKRSEGREVGVWKLEVYDSLDEFREMIPKDILPIIEKKLQGIFIEDLDI
jgi:EXLDI family protein